MLKVTAVTTLISLVVGDSLPDLCGVISELLFLHRTLGEVRLCSNLPLQEFGFVRIKCRDMFSSKSKLGWKM